MSSSGSVIDYRTTPVVGIEPIVPPIPGEAIQLSLEAGFISPYPFKAAKELSIMTGVVV